MTRAHIAKALHLSPRTISTAIAVAVAAGVLTARQPRRRAPYTFRVITNPAGRWDEIPDELHSDLTSRAIPRAYLPTWLHLDRILGNKGRTTDTPAEIAKTLGITVRCLRRHVAAFVRLGHLIVTGARDHKWSLWRPGHEPKTAPTEPTKTPDRMTMDCNLNEPPIATLSTSAPVSPAPESILVTPRSGVPLSDARPPDDGELRSKRKPPPTRSPRQHRRTKRARQPIDIQACIDAMPPDLRHGYAAGQWRNGIVARITRALSGGLSALAACRAMAERVDLDREPRHILAVERALASMAGDVRRGLACHGCGADAGWHHPDCPDLAVPGEVWAA